MSASGTNRFIACPGCGKMLTLVEKQGNPARLQAYRACDTGRMRAVYETDNPDYVTEQDRLEPSEPVVKRPSTSTYLRSKKK